MNKALAATISISVGLVWIAAFLFCVYLYATGLFRVRQRMREQGMERLGLFWTAQVFNYAWREGKQLDDARRLRRGFLGAVGLCALMVALMVAIVAVRGHAG